MVRPRPRRARALAAALLLWIAAAGRATHADAGPAAPAPQVRPPDLIAVPAGPFIIGSDRAEREAAYRLDEAAYGHGRTREWKWYENEPARQERTLAAFEITRTPITNAQYARFVAATGHPPPDVDAATWRGYGLVHPFARTRRHAWAGGRPPRGRKAHPVVLVSHADARAYARWLSDATGRTWRLPDEAEWEKAARGPAGNRFAWGDAWRPDLLNSHDRGPFDTMAVASFPGGASPYGLRDAAGQVYEWTATPVTGGGGARFIVKGGSWDDSGCGICRPAARHGRPAALKHILIGFRLVAD